jgi:hypothetical protein
MTHILNDYKSGGGYLDGDSKEIWQQLQTSINNFGNNIATPSIGQRLDEVERAYPNVLTMKHRIWLETHLTRLGEETSSSMSIAHDVIRRGRYSDWEQNELNEMRKIMIEINGR